MSAATSQVLDRLEAATKALASASQAAIQLSRTVMMESAARRADDDDWLRMPSPKARCPISGWSRSGVERRVAAGEVRRKRIDGCVFYAGADVRRVMNEG